MQQRADREKEQRTGVPLGTLPSGAPAGSLPASETAVESSNRSWRSQTSALRGANGAVPPSAAAAAVPDVQVSLLVRNSKHSPGLLEGLCNSTQHLGQEECSVKQLLALRTSGPHAWAVVIPTWPGSCAQEAVDDVRAEVAAAKATLNQLKLKRLNIP